MADEYDPFNLKKHPGYYAELVQERDPTVDVAASFAKTHAYDGGILGKLEQNPHGWGDSPLPYDPAQPELRSTSPGGSANQRDYATSGGAGQFEKKAAQGAFEAGPFGLPIAAHYGGGLIADAALNAKEGAFGKVAGDVAELAMFIGPGARTANKGMLAKAEAMAKAGAPREAIWNETGWFKGGDGKWRSEIHDRPARVTPNELRDAQPKETVDLPGVLRHDELFDAYPEFEQTGVQHREYPAAAKDAFGSYVKRADEIVLNNEHPFFHDNDSMRSSLLHELQHKIQHAEGFPAGGSFLGKNAVAGNLDEYRRLAGEVEARNVQKRRDMSREERANTPPWLTEDVPGDQQITNYGATNGPELGTGDVLAKMREIDARGFYSPTLEAAKAIKQEKGTVSQFRSMLLSAGGKPKELEAIGFDKAFPDPNQKVSRADIEQYLRDNRVQLGQNVQGVDIAKARREIEQTANDPNNPHRAKAQADLARLDAGDYRVLDDWDMLTERRDYESYSTPGGIPGSYREVVTTLPPSRDPGTELSALKAKQEELGGPLAPGQEMNDINRRIIELEKGKDLYTSSHWPGITNPLLHYRVKDFQDVSSNRPAPATDGSVTVPSAQGSGDFLGAPGSANVGVNQSKVRVLDEMQSDWAQGARDYGTRSERDMAHARSERDRFEAERDATEIAMAEHLKQYGFAPELMPSEAPDYLEAHLAKTKDPVGEKLMQDWNTQLERLGHFNTILNNDRGVPSAPYISNTSDWVDLGLKQALIDAARDPSVSRLAWAPGKVQADRYNLGKQVSALIYHPEKNQIGIRPRGSNHWEYKSLTENSMEDLVGKELSEKLRAAPLAENTTGTPGWRQLDLDEGTHIGGEGMKSFYGDMTPEGYQSGIVGTRLQKLVKGLDPGAARVEPQTLPGQYEGTIGGRMYQEERGMPRPELQYPSVPITPKMREKILKEGLPLFNIAALSALVSRMLGQGPQSEDNEQ